MTTNGDIVANDSGAVTLNIAGDFNGNYLGSTGTGIANLTLASTGVMQSASLGTAADTFTFQGGTINGTLNGGNSAAMTRSRAILALATALRSTCRTSPASNTIITSPAR